ncbi:LysR family transcriptional regulator [Lujinxingia vulgaris]|uniref:LysR family transcriptional regulator n=1 Tax=Lujinxingia vulgaris TaxID=2600176 RepID=A0A5C6XA98_9DELT|nr:LysR family transcriptional regulator [Lujinxingia vulgaris]TXD36125.1 LysR family transcriptional regulator [Lujinxingia vulgaris]
MAEQQRGAWAGVSLEAIWNWLPAFRAVAEAEHLPTAAARLHVSSPALSRTVRLLEEHLEVELFNRVGRRLVLNTAGEQLLAAVQEAMGGLGRVVEEVQVEGVGGRLRVGSLGVLTNSFVLPAALALCERHPQLLPMLENHRPRDANEKLWRGELDVAFYYEGLSAPGVEVEELGRIGASVYCGKGHPLFERAAEVGEEEVLCWPFSVPQVGDSGQVMDGWPVDVSRRVGMQITLLTTNVEVCRSGRFVTVLPDVAARPWVERGEVRRVGFEGLEGIRVFGAVREQEVGRSGAREMLEEVGRRVREDLLVRE